MNIGLKVLIFDVDGTLGESVLDRIEVTRTGDVVKRKKPAADIYRYVIDKIGLSSDECIAFEDSKIGFDSANSAGLSTVSRLASILRKKTLKGLLLRLTVWETKINHLKSLKVVRPVIHLSV